MRAAKEEAVCATPPFLKSTILTYRRGTGRWERGVVRTEGPDVPRGTEKTRL